MTSTRLESPQQLIGELLHLKDFPASVHPTDSPATMSWCGNRFKHRSHLSPSLSCKGQQPHRDIRNRFIIASILALIATVYFCWLKYKSRLSSASFTRRLAEKEYMLLGIDLEACDNVDNAAGVAGPSTVNVLRVYSKPPAMHSDEGPALGNRADNERIEMHLNTAHGQTATARIDEWLMDPIENLEALINAETEASTPGSSLNCSNIPLVDQNVSASTGMKGVYPLLQLSNDYSPSAGHLDESVSGTSSSSTVAPNDLDSLQASIDQLTAEESALIDQLLDTLDEDLILPEPPATTGDPFLPASASSLQTPDQQPAKRQRTADFGAIDGRWTGAIDGRWAGPIDGRWAGPIDGRWAGAIDGRWAGAIDGKWAGAIDGSWPATLMPSTRLGTQSVLAHTLGVAQFPGQGEVSANKQSALPCFAPVKSQEPFDCMHVSSLGCMRSARTVLMSF
ncbi:hypothetical protein, conserved [Eimeria necatrix]|uniref:Uncharacterized protein n=1 Tax=Eimeria necatrix TaxID=51315 RepID=U6MQA4_9EIME|nr:hypothetical protein, conserved [Eimeria necatrix]CDJ65258.1 hypothetical protein, conserved [Eimeria necatrix]